jgi:hypothetical protein
MTGSAATAAGCALSVQAGAFIARAADPAPELPPFDCALVRSYVAHEVAALAWAVRNGFTAAQIAAARRCLR